MKRTMSKKQKAALARGRRALARSRRKAVSTRKKSRKKPPLSRIPRHDDRVVIINQSGEEGEIGMDGRRKRRKVRRCSTGFKARRRSRPRSRSRAISVRDASHAMFFGYDGAGRRSRRRRSRYMGGGLPIKGITNRLMNAGIEAAAAVGSTMAAAKIPIENPKIKAAIPLVAGIAIGMLAKGKRAAMINKVSDGCMIAGLLALLKQVAPQFALAGEDELTEAYLPEDDQSLLGVRSDLMGVPSDLMGTEDFELESEEVY